MTKNQTVDKAVSIFSLSRFKVGCYYNTVSADFTPSLRPNNHFEEVVPMFNHDKNSNTPAFILPNEQSYYSNNPEFERGKFEERVVLGEEKNSNQTLFNPVPSSTYCQICKETYQDYQEHIMTKYHLRHLRASKANHFINELVQMLARKDKKLNQANKTKPIKKTGKRKTGTRIKKSSIPSLLAGGEVPETKPSLAQNKIYNYSTNVASELVATL